MFYNGDFETPGIVFSSWSGGKDSALAFYKAKQYFRRVDYIFTMFDETCKRTRSHGLKKQIIETQAKSMGVKFLCGCAGWENYEEVFTGVLEKHFKGGVGVFGDIDIQEHLNWVIKVCSRVDVKVFEPLWKMNRKEIIEEFISLGFKAKVVTVKKGYEELLGREIDHDFIDLAGELGADICGENGEYHTIVYDGPGFKDRIDI